LVKIIFIQILKQQYGVLAEFRIYISVWWW